MGLFLFFGGHILSPLVNIHTLFTRTLFEGGKGESHESIASFGSSGFAQQILTPNNFGRDRPPSCSSYATITTKLILFHILIGFLTLFSKNHIINSYTTSSPPPPPTSTSLSSILGGYNNIRSHCAMTNNGPPLPQGNDSADEGAAG